MRRQISWVAVSISLAHLEINTPCMKRQETFIHGPCADTPRKRNRLNVISVVKVFPKNVLLKETRKHKQEKSNSNVISEIKVLSGEIIY